MKDSFSLTDHIAAEFFVNDTMSFGTVICVRDHGDQVLGFKAIDVKRLLHREGGCHQSGTFQTPGRDDVGRGVGDMQKRYLNSHDDLIRHLVHGVCRKQQQLCSTPFQCSGLGVENQSGDVRVGRGLKLRYPFEIHGSDEKFGRVQTT